MHARLFVFWFCVLTTENLDRDWVCNIDLSFQPVAKAVGHYKLVIILLLLLLSLLSCAVGSCF